MYPWEQDPEAPNKPISVFPARDWIGPYYGPQPFWGGLTPVIRPVGMRGMARMGQQVTASYDVPWWQRILNTVGGILQPGGSYPYPYPTTYPTNYPGGTYPTYYPTSSSIDWTTVLLVGGGIFLIATMTKKK